MFPQIKAATRMTKWDAQTIIPSFDSLCCHHYQLDIWMKNQLKNFDPCKKMEKTNSIIWKSLEEYRTLALSYAVPLLHLCSHGEKCVRPPSLLLGIAVPTPGWAGSETPTSSAICLGPLCKQGLGSSVPLIKHSKASLVLCRLKRMGKTDSLFLCCQGD